MQFERFIARKFLKKGEGFTSSLVSIAIWSIALGVIVMLMSVTILRGFQSEIEQKVVGFGSHIVAKSQFIGNSYEEQPISTNRPDLQRIKSVNGVKHVQFYATKGGMIKTDDQIQGIIFKGVDNGFDTSFFTANLVEGRLFQFPAEGVGNEIIVSRQICEKLHLQIGDKLRTYFWQGNNYRARAFSIVGIYNTDLSDFDEHYIIGDLAQVQKLNGWDDTLVGGYEILVNDISHLDQLGHEVAMQCGYDIIVSTIRQDNPALFAWLDLLNSNIVIILIVMAIVCCVAVISALLIMIFEKTSMIGLLKTLGATHKSIRNIFLIKSIKIIAIGLVIGNLIALILSILQSRFHVIHLDPENYFMSYVPIHINLWNNLLISLGTLLACLLALLIPASIIARIDPAKSIKVE